MDSIAIVGVANLFPGSDTPEQFWQQLLDKKDFRAPLTHDRFDLEPEKYLGKKGELDKYYCMSGGYIREFDFDASVLVDAATGVGNGGLTLDYLQGLDDIYQWALYVAHRALTDAGYWGSERLNDCGVIFGNLSFPTKSSNHLFMPLYHLVVEDALKALVCNDFQLSNFTAKTRNHVHPDNALVAGYPSSIIAKAAGLGGAHFSLDAACASSCYAIKLACDYLNTGRANMMLAGAICAADQLVVTMGFSVFQAYPENNVHAPLDNRTQGLFSGEGAGMLVLKRLSDAVRDNDTIHAVIRGGGLSNDGRGEFITSPNPKGQVLAFQRAYLESGVNPADIDYIECHATGTPKGDRVEINSLETFFSDRCTEAASKPLLGSVKSNLGHLLTAAGMASVVKTIWGLKTGKIPATINVQEPISSRNGFFGGAQIPTETIAWPGADSGKPKMAGVNVFGFGGTNAHLILQQAGASIAETPVPARAREPMAIVGMAAHFGSADSLAAFEHLIKNNGNTFRDLPPRRWKSIEANAAVMAALTLSAAPQGGYIESFEIDLAHFKIPPSDNDCLIPQQLLAMKMADAAARDAGLRENSNVAVLVAMGLELELHQFRGRVNLLTQIETSLAQQGLDLPDAERRQLTEMVTSAIDEPTRMNRFVSFIGNTMASRVSALWDFNGPAFTVSAEENSVYRCVELAQALFQTSEVEAVIIAAVDLAGSLENISLRRRFGEVALQVESSSAGNVLDRNRWLVGEGAGAIVLRPLSKATSGGVYATIDGVGASNGERAEAITAAAERAFASTGLSASDITVVEAHASGFTNENAAEQRALSSLYPGCAVSSVKSNVGHTFNASGIASILKWGLLLDASDVPSAPRIRVAVNGLGADGSSCHVILSSPSEQRRVTFPADKKKPQLNRTITLGGQSIYQSIVAQRDTAAIKAMQRKVTGVKLTPVALPIQVRHIRLESTLRDKTQRDIPLNKDSVHSTGAPMAVGGVVEGPRQLLDSNGDIMSCIDQEIAAHNAFLNSRHIVQEKISELIALQAQISSGTAPAQLSPNRREPGAGVVITPDFGKKGRNAYRPLVLKERFKKPDAVLWDYPQLVEFAEGKVANVFGEQYSIIDTYRRRIRLPRPDYLLVTRVTAIDAKISEFRKSYLSTEYDIPIDAPYLVDGQIPWCIAAESGQCPMFLMSYIGADLLMKGERAYRLLDGEITFFEEMPFGGQTLRYDIHINSFAWSGDTLALFFTYDGYVGDRKILSMRNGSAGLFSDKELSTGNGVTDSPLDKRELQKVVKTSFTPLIRRNPGRTHYDYDDMRKLVRGDIAGCFGPQYEQRGRNPSLRIAAEKYLMVHRITAIDESAGHWGLGVVEGERDLRPDEWFFLSHFKDDHVMPGSLMVEGGWQLMMFYMLALGMHGHVNNARFQPLTSEPLKMRFRGQISPQSNVLKYRMEVTAIGMRPWPHMRANIRIYLGEKPVTDVKNLGIKIAAQDEHSPYAVQLLDDVQRV
jgi:acyl transferase domain-containing protein/3-hydroxymyristoyl/3-hydroxydecanoyl-(acyl carrier protein) dehydratase